MSCDYKCNLPSGRHVERGVTVGVGVELEGVSAYLRAARSLL